MTSTDSTHTKEVRGFRFVMNIWNIDLRMYFRSFVSEREFVCVVVCHYYLLDFVSLRKERDVGYLV